MKISLLVWTRFVLTSAIAVGFSTSAFGADWPKTPADFAAKGPADMKPFADVKVTLGKSIPPASLKNKSETELSLMRNSIFAQAGLTFSEPWLQHYFGSRPWYKPGKFDPKALSKVDFENVKMIYDYQKSNNLITMFTAFKKSMASVLRKPRSTASTSSFKMDSKSLMKMRYCNLIMDGSAMYKFTFHHNKVLTVEAGDNKGRPYGAGEEGAYEEKGAYEGGAYEESGWDEGSSYDDGGGDKRTGKSVWKITNGRVNASVNGGQYVFDLIFTKNSIASHECYF